MQTLIIYDSTGYIVSRVAGETKEPIGIPYMWVDVPQGKHVDYIDISLDTHVPVFVDLPLTEQQKIQQLEADNADMMYALMMGGLI